MHIRATDRARVVMWELTRACKLGCAHCANDARPKRSPLELSTYEAYKTIDQIVALNPDELIITGGDPFERVDLYQLIDYARRRGLQPALMVSPTPLLTGAAIGKLKRHGLARIIISLDSPAPDRSGGHFGAELLAIRWARTAELPVEINTLLDRHNLSDLQTLAELLGDLDVYRWNLYFPVPVGGAKAIDMPTAEETEAVFAKLHELSARVPFPIRTFEAPHYRRFVLQKAVEEGEAVRNASVAVNNFLYVTHTGEVTISPFLPLTAGNVRYQPLSTLFRYSELFAAVRDEGHLRGKCGRCDYRGVCGGSRARAFAMTGDLFAADPLCAYHPGTEN